VKFPVWIRVGSRLLCPTLFAVFLNAISSIYYGTFGTAHCISCISPEIRRICFQILLFIKKTGPHCFWVLENKHSFSIWLYSPLDLGPFFSFFILYTVGRTPWAGDQLVARPLPSHRINAHTDIHALSGIRTHDPNVRARQESSCLRPRGHSDRRE
jgi:hypothetical protein